MKKLLTALIIISMIVVCFAGCDRTAPPIEYTKIVKSCTDAMVFKPMVLANKSEAMHSVKPIPDFGFPLFHGIKKGPNSEPINFG